MDRTSSNLGALWLLASACCTVGCGDLTDSVGKQGRLEFSLATDYEVEGTELTDATIVAGHQQHLSVDLTTKGEDDIEQPEQIAYRMKPDEGVKIETIEAGRDQPTDVEVWVKTPGKYELEAVYKGKIVDSIDLAFDTPDALEISVKVRFPYSEKFTDVDVVDTLEVVEGTQATFLPIPLKGEKRLAGSITTEVKATPQEAVVPGKGASGVYEQNVWSVEGNIDFYFIDPGEVTIAITDPVSNASGEYTFTVTDVGS